MGLDAAGDIFVVPGFAEFSPAGQPDATVTSSALIATSHGGSETFLASGQAVFGQSVGVVKGDVDIQVQRVNANGGVTSTSALFDYTGQDGSGRDGAGAIAIDGNGKALVGGAHFFNTSIFGLARVNADGSLDTSFGSGGTLTTTFQGDEAVGALVIQADGKIVAIGYSEDNSTGQVDIALARYLAQ